MFKRRPGQTRHAADASAYSRRAAVADSLWDAQDRARIRPGGRLPGRSSEPRPLGLRARRLRRSRRRLVWPLEDRAASDRGPARALSFGAVVLVAAARRRRRPDLGRARRAAQRQTATEVAADAAAGRRREPVRGEAAPQPTLHGAAPVFKPAQGTARRRGRPRQGDRQVDRRRTRLHPASSTAASAASSDQSASSPHPPPKQPPPLDGAARPARQAIAVARDFAGAFVVYETGGVDGTVRKPSATTATPAAGPRAAAAAAAAAGQRQGAEGEGRQRRRRRPPTAASTRSASRCCGSALTSELRLELEQLKGNGWRVTNVLG